MEVVTYRKGKKEEKEKDERKKSEYNLFAEAFLRGVAFVIERLENILEEYGGNPVPREKIAAVSGDVYSITRKFEKMKEEYRFLLERLNFLLTDYGKEIPKEAIEKVLSEISCYIVSTNASYDHAPISKDLILHAKICKEYSIGILRRKGLEINEEEFLGDGILGIENYFENLKEKYDKNKRLVDTLESLEKSYIILASLGSISLSQKRKRPRD